jgi:hypothetical protein
VASWTAAYALSSALQNHRVVFRGLSLLIERDETCGFTPRFNLLRNQSVFPRRSMPTRALGMEFCDYSQSSRPKQASDVPQDCGCIIGMMQDH